MDFSNDGSRVFTPPPNIKDSMFCNPIAVDHDDSVIEFTSNGGADCSLMSALPPEADVLGIWA
jgi:hypothetical protein